MSEPTKIPGPASSFTALFGRWFRFSVVLMCAALMVWAVILDPGVLVPATIAGVVAWIFSK